MTPQTAQTSFDCIEQTLSPFIFSDFWDIYSQGWNGDELIVVGCLPNSENFYIAKFYEQDGPKHSWVAHSLTMQ
mgnify:CR=1 FL=1